MSQFPNSDFILYPESDDLNLANDEIKVEPDDWRKYETINESDKIPPEIKPNQEFSLFNETATDFCKTMEEPTPPIHPTSKSSHLPYDENKIETFWDVFYFTPLEAEVNAKIKLATEEDLIYLPLLHQSSEEDIASTDFCMIKKELTPQIHSASQSNSNHKISTEKSIPDTPIEEKESPQPSREDEASADDFCMEKGEPTSRIHSTTLSSSKRKLPTEKSLPDNRIEEKKSPQSSVDFCVTKAEPTSRIDPMNQSNFNYKHNGIEKELTRSTNSKIPTFINPYDKEQIKSFLDIICFAPHENQSNLKNKSPTGNPPLSKPPDFKPPESKLAKSTSLTSTKETRIIDNKTEHSDHLKPQNYSPQSSIRPTETIKTDHISSTSEIKMKPEVKCPAVRESESHTTITSNKETDTTSKTKRPVKSKISTSLSETKKSNHVPSTSEIKMKPEVKCPAVRESKSHTTITSNKETDTTSKTKRPVKSKISTSLSETKKSNHVPSTSEIKMKPEVKCPAVRESKSHTTITSNKETDTTSKTKRPVKSKISTSLSETKKSNHVPSTSEIKMKPEIKCPAVRESKSHTTIKSNKETDTTSKTKRPVKSKISTSLSETKKSNHVPSTSEIKMKPGVKCPAARESEPHATITSNKETETTSKTKRPVKSKISTSLSKTKKIDHVPSTSEIKMKPEVKCPAVRESESHTTITSNKETDTTSKTKRPVKSKIKTSLSKTKKSHHVLSTSEMKMMPDNTHSTKRESDSNMTITSNKETKIANKRKESVKSNPLSPEKYPYQCNTVPSKTRRSDHISTAHDIKRRKLEIPCIAKKESDSKTKIEPAQLVKDFKQAFETEHIPILDKTCWNCGVQGHFRYSCKNSFVKFCSSCGRKNVFSKDCCKKELEPLPLSGKSDNNHLTSKRDPYPSSREPTKTKKSDNIPSISEIKMMPDNPRSTERESDSKMTITSNKETKITNKRKESVTVPSKTRTSNYISTAHDVNRRTLEIPCTAKIESDSQTKIETAELVKNFKQDFETEHIPILGNTCWKCGVQGHSRSRCKNSFVKFCSSCGRKNVFSKDCCKKKFEPLPLSGKSVNNHLTSKRDPLPSSREPTKTKKSDHIPSTSEIKMMPDNPRSTERESDSKMTITSNKETKITNKRKESVTVPSKTRWSDHISTAHDIKRRKLEIPCTAKKESDSKTKIEPAQLVRNIKQAFETEHIPILDNTCWNCGVQGHFRSSCKNSYVKFGSSCGRKNVFTKDCREKELEPLPLPGLMKHDIKTVPIICLLCGLSDCICKIHRKKSEKERSQELKIKPLISQNIYWNDRKPGNDHESIHSWNINCPRCGCKDCVCLIQNRIYDDVRSQNWRIKPPIYLKLTENTCWKCGFEGHFPFQCTGEEILFCYRCGRIDVTTQSCCGIRGTREDHKGVDEEMGY